MTAIGHNVPAEAPGPSSSAREPSICDPGAVPRVLRWIVVKRIDPRLPNTWGHWWIELDGGESYGWWPAPCPMGWKGAMLGSRGCLNGIGTGNGGTPTRDAYHGEEPDHWFHPTLVVEKTDEEIRADIRAFAHRFVGGFRWQWWWLRDRAENCRTFQDDLFAYVGLYEEPEYLYTRGPGCPFMMLFRRVRWRVEDSFDAAVERIRGSPPDRDALDSARRQAAKLLLSRSRAETGDGQLASEDNRIQDG